MKKFTIFSENYYKVNDLFAELSKAVLELPAVKEKAVRVRNAYPKSSHCFVQWEKSSVKGKRIDRAIVRFGSSARNSTKILSFNFWYSSMVIKKYPKLMDLAEEINLLYHA